MRRTLYHFTAVFFFLTGIAQAAVLMQSPPPLPSSPSDFSSLHFLVELFTPLNSFAAGVLWTRLSAMKEDIRRIDFSFHKFRDDFVKDIFNSRKGEKDG